MEIDMLSVLLSRIQMGFTLGMHILFPSLNIGLATFICIMEALWLKTKNPLYLKICKYWIKIFALAFGMGVVTGIVMAYELGTNFGRFTNAIGEVLGSLFVYEVLSAFFLEAGFLGIMLMGWNRTSPKMHFVATFMVAFGTIFSAFWIMSANSWMQVPSGFIHDPATGKFLVDSWWTAIFNPTLIPRFLHMLLATFITASFFIIGVSAWYLLKKRHEDMAKKCFSFTFWAVLVLIPLQWFVGDDIGRLIQKYQPLKTAAIEAVWQTQDGAPLLLFAWPDEKLEKNLFEIGIPYGASILNTHQVHGELVGLTSVPPEDRPPVVAPFFSFRIMVGIAVLFTFMMFYALWLRRGNKLYTTRWFQRLCVLSTPLGFVAVISGWITAEIGRQPWVVYGYLRTTDGASPIAAEHVAFSLAAFIFIYLFILCFFLNYLFRLIRKGPQDLNAEPETIIYMPHITNNTVVKE